MKTIMKNRKRKLVQEIGTYMNTRFTIYDNDGIMEVWFSDEQKALNHWHKIKNRETWKEKRDKERRQRLQEKHNYLYSDEFDDIESLPFC